MKNIKDFEFIRTSIPMTKFNVRNLSIAYLKIERGDNLLDIGGGTGSISIEAALNGANVTTVEFNTEACNLIKQNVQKFNTELNLIEGRFPDILLKEEYKNFQFNKCFIGGSSGELKNIFDYCEKHLKSTGIICANFILIKNLNRFLELTELFNYKDIEVNLIQTAAMEKNGLFKSENPIYIAKAVKQ